MRDLGSIRIIGPRLLVRVGHSSDAYEEGFELEVERKKFRGGERTLEIDGWDIIGQVKSIERLGSRRRSE